MQKSISITSDFDHRNVMSDIGSRFADSPMHRIGFDITDADVQTLAEIYRDRVFRAVRKAAPDQIHWLTLLLRFADDLFLLARGDGREWAEVIASTEERANTLYAEVAAKLRASRTQEKPFFYMLRYDSCEFHAERVEEVTDDPGEEFLQLCYGPDIEDWLGQFDVRTAHRPGGLTIFEGPSGTGKTSLVSVMMRRFAHSHLFYVLPAAQGEALVSPELLPFWRTQNKQHPDRIKVIVLEDAERLLWPRTQANRDAVSSMLNIADGLVGRMLRLHLLCSVNVSTGELDPAIMRPGRLMNQRTFGRLPRQVAERLAGLKDVPFRCDDGREEFVLAEILNPVIKAPTPKPRIGFGA